MRALAIRTALTGWFVGLAALLLIGVCAALVLGLRSTYRAGLDDRLLARAQSLLALTEWEADDGFEIELTDELNAQLRVAHPSESIEVWHAPALLMFHRSGASIPLAPPAMAMEGDRHHRFDVASSGDGRSIRVCTAWSRVRMSDESERDDEAGRNDEAGRDDEDERDDDAIDGSDSAARDLAVIVRVADEIIPVTRQLGSVHWFLLPLILLTVASVFAFGLLISRRFTRPILELGTAAEAARVGALRKMPRRGSGDELDRLADTLDQSFGALHAALERQTRFTSDAAHELRNPLAVLYSAAEVALRRDRSIEEYKASLGDILGTARRMRRIVESLLLLARMDDRARQHALAKVALDEIAQAIACGTERSRLERVRQDIAEGPMYVAGDEGLLGVLVDNLISNALKHTAGPVDVRVGRRDDRVVLTVRDYGEEVTAAALSNAFERFVTLETPGRSRDGAGLGLSIVTSVVGMHGAELRVVDAHPGLAISVEFAAAS